MKSIVYITCWAVLFATGTTAVTLINGKFQHELLSEFLQTQIATKVARLICFIVFFSAASLVLWGWLNLEWSMILVNWFVGLVSAGFVRKFARVSDLFYFGPFIVVLLNVVLWASKGM